MRFGFVAIVLYALVSCNLPSEAPRELLHRPQNVTDMILRILSRTKTAIIFIIRGILVVTTEKFPYRYARTGFSIRSKDVRTSSECSTERTAWLAIKGDGGKSPTIYG